MSNTKKTVLITGGCGAIGVNLVDKLLEREAYNILVIDNLSSGMNLLPESVELSNIDISNKEKLDGFFSRHRPNIIYHLAAHFANQNSVEHPVSDTATNIVGLINIFESQTSNMKLEKIVYASSSCVYGNSTIMSEDDNVSPYDTPYAINKYVGELYCKYYSEIRRMPTVCGRVLITLAREKSRAPIETLFRISF